MIIWTVFGQAGLIDVVTNLTANGEEVGATVNVTLNEIFAKEGLADADYSDYDGNVTDDSLRLVGEEGCDNYQMNKIFSGWYDAYKLMGEAGDGDVDWNEAAALEYLGAPAQNKAQRSPIKGKRIPIQALQLLVEARQ